MTLMRLFVSHIMNGMNGDVMHRQKFTNDLKIMLLGHKSFTIFQGYKCHENGLISFQE